MTKGIGQKSEIPVLPELARKIGKANKKRNLVLVVMIAVCTVALFSLLTLARGRILADRLKDIRENASMADGVLNSASREQFESISRLGYIDNTGVEKDFGICYLNQRRLCDCSIMAEDDFFNMYAPAYENLTGSYPNEAKEVMLSVHTLNDMGITDPKPGMEIPLYIVRNDWMTSNARDIEETFVLSGYYTDYSKQMDELKTAYFSLEFMKENKMELFPADILINSDVLFLTADQLQEQLYRDVSVGDGQRFLVWNTGVSENIKMMFGGYAIALLGVGLILYGLCLFIYNILTISFERDRKQYGLLKVVGISPKQMRILFLIQSLKILSVGILFGIATGYMFAVLVLEKLVGRMYLAGTGSLTGVDVFSAGLLGVSILFTAVAAGIAFYRSMDPLLRLSPISCLHGSPAISPQRGFRIRCKRNALLEMAWRNVNRDRRKMIITLSSLFLGIQAALLSVCITKGLDQTNRILENPDFTVSITKEAVESHIYENVGWELNEVQGHELLTEDLILDILALTGVQREDIKECIGAYGIMEAKFLDMMPGTEQEIKERITELTIQVVPDEWLAQLADYVKKEELTVDLDTFSAGKGFLFLHENRLPDGKTGEAEKNIGEIFPFFVVEDGGKNVELLCSGYLDITQEGFPALLMPWEGRNLNHLIVSEKTFHEMNCEPRTYSISFDVQKEKEPGIKRAIQTLLVHANQNEQISNFYEMTANSDILAAQESYILATRVVMGTFSGILIFLAAVNYGNTIITSIVSREPEFAVMRNLGMTRKQLRIMLLWEGNCYCICTLGLVLSIGSILLGLVKVIIEKKVPYFVFHYPLPALILIVGMFLMGNILIVWVSHKRYRFHDKCRI